jgi:hypothetical protein
MKRLGTLPKVDIKFAKWYISARGNIPMRSGYEVAYAHYLDAKGVVWQYEPMTFYIGPSKSYHGKTYTPDFYLPIYRTYVEIKGRYPRADQAKVAAFKRTFPQLTHVVIKGLDFRSYVGHHFMAIGGTAPRVLQSSLLATLNNRICFH